MNGGQTNGMTAVLIDDDPQHLDLMRQSLETVNSDELQFTIHTYEDAGRALADLPPVGPVVIICDLRLAGTTGLDWLPDFLRADVGPVIFVTSSGDERIASEAFRHGAADYMNKATVFQNPERLRSAIQESHRRYRIEHTNRDLARKLKLANAELKRKNIKLAELTETAHRFVDDVAHEFRTPLAVIKEFASILEDGIGGNITNKQAEYLHFISDASRDLAHLIDDFLDSGKLRAQTLRVERREYSVDDLIESCWQMLEARASAKRIVLQKHIDPNLPTVYADADKVRRSIINLVVNAIKFSNFQDTVTVSVVAVPAGGVELRVSDHGPGLSEEEVKRLFERFRQGGEANRISTKGFGLGLNIVKELVAINLGVVSVKSTLGEGSVFSFTLPANENEQIVDAFLQRTRERSPKATIAVLSAKRTQPSASIEELRAFVASVCHPTDIQVVAADGASLYIIGDTIEPARWCERMIEQDNESRSYDSQGTVAPLAIEHIGSLPIESFKSAILRIINPKPEAPCRV